MRFEDERYVRLFVRDTTTWRMLPWQGRCIFPLILRKLDRAGLLDLGADGLEALAVHLEVPLDVVAAGMPELLRREVLVMNADGLLWAPKYLEAQEAKASDKARQKACRERARDLAEATRRGVPVLEDPTDATVTNRDANITARDETVTRGHTASQPVTPSHAVPSHAVPSHAVPSHAVPFVCPPLASLAAPDGAEPKKRRRSMQKPNTACPASDETTDDVNAWANRWKVPADHREFERFLDHHRSKGSLFADWAAAWRTWLKNAERFNGPRAKGLVQSAENRAWVVPKEML